MQDAHLALIPKPLTVILGGDDFVLTPTTMISAGSCEGAGMLLANYLRPATGFPLPVVSGAQDDSPMIALALNESLVGGDEAYRIEVNVAGVRLQARSETGLKYAVQTLRQLLPSAIFSARVVRDVVWRIPGIVVEDAPRFGWRGGHLDVCRHFFDADYVKHYIDLLALHKFNRFHWHLTDDQGWRIEIQRYPRLAEVGAWRKETMIGHYSDTPRRFDGRPYGGYYTQAQIRDVVAYAQARGIMVLPEIEMPGHAQAAIAAYPELGNVQTPLDVGREWGIIENVFNVEATTLTFLQHVLEEVLDLFPGRHIHIGGDEVPKTQWKHSPQVQARMKALGLADEDALQSYFIRQMDMFLTSRERVLVGWDEILEGGLAANAIVMSWRGEEGGIAAARQNHDVVMCPWQHTYFDHYQVDPQSEGVAIGGLTTLEKVYGYEPIPPALSPDEARHVLGTQGQLWTEYIPTPERLEYMAYPRLCALAEVAWSPRERDSFANFRTRLRAHAQRLDAMKVHYCRQAVGVS
jgi:hexosaminidase